MPGNHSAIVTCSETKLPGNLILSEVEFDEFKRHCREKGFDLSYFSAAISGSRKEIEQYKFESPKSIKLRKRLIGFEGTPYDVAEWQQEKWISVLPQIKEDFFRGRREMTRVDSFWFGSIVINGRKYGCDVLIFPDGTVRKRRDGFWKFGSHAIKRIDIEELVRVKPEVLVVGTGTNGRARLTSEAEAYARAANISFTSAPSSEAIQQLNQFIDQGKQVAALIHITC